MDGRAIGWVVFYTERGDESAVRIHTDEAAACLDLLERVRSYEHNYFDLVAGPAPPLKADELFQTWLADHNLTLEGLSASDWKTQDSAWKSDEPDYRRYWVRITRIRAVAQ